MLVQCPTCILKFNNETAKSCGACKVPKKKPPSRKKRDKKFWERVKLHAHKIEDLEHTQVMGGTRQKYSYFAKGKRKPYQQH